ncbi:response regulator [Methyloligella sp. 2.7D]|uniref:response regulator n=1 Tax=unclassified Methyloligella TaxID=2625955 RepID=UPI00157C5969|nr:response regulator [Methyloligella sp. GL2]QKP76114.1 response regulator [Methyloligella sp. GL2]
MPEELQRILYLEDIDEIAEIGMMALEDIGGFTVKRCATGKDAVAAFPEFKPQLCLFDVMLPDISGLEALDAIRALPGGNEAAVVFMTAKAQAHEQEQYRQNGVLDVILKPFEPMTLSDTVRAIWDEHRSKAAAGT